MRREWTWGLHQRVCLKCPPRPAHTPSPQGLHVRQTTPHGGSVEFVPAFLSASQVGVGLHRRGPSAPRA